MASQRWPVGVVERRAQQMDHTGLHDRRRPHLADGLGQPFAPIADQHAPVADAAIAQFGEDLRPELAAAAGPQPEDVAAAVDGDGQRDLDRPVGDLPVADLHMNRIQEDHRTHRVERPVLPTRPSRRGPCRRRRRRSASTPRRRTPRPGARRSHRRSAPFDRQRQHPITHTGQASLAFTHDLRHEAAASVAQHPDHDKADADEHHLGPAPLQESPLLSPATSCMPQPRCSMISP